MEREFRNIFNCIEIKGYFNSQVINLKYESYTLHQCSKISTNNFIEWKMQNSSALLIFNSVRISDKILVNNKKMNNWGCGAAGSALAWHARGHGFDPRQLHFLI